VSWSRPADRAAIGRAGLLFEAAWIFLFLGPWGHGQIVDTPVYQHYGELITHGQIPYRDFTPEYPPLALPVFVLPAAFTSGIIGYTHAFEVVMAVLGVLLVIAVGLARPPVCEL
jgi:hypothetical protein